MIVQVHRNSTCLRNFSGRCFCLCSTTWTIKRHFRPRSPPCWPLTLPVPLKKKLIKFPHKYPRRKFPLGFWSTENSSWGERFPRGMHFHEEHFPRGTLPAENSYRECCPRGVFLRDLPYRRISHKIPTFNILWIWIDKYGKIKYLNP